MISKVFCSIAVLLAVGCAACGSCDPAPSPPGGSVSLAWSLIDRFRDPTTCEHVGATTVTVGLRNHASGARVTASLRCAAARGTSPLVVPGAYDVTVSLDAADGTSLATIPGQLAVTVVAGQVAALAPVTFTVDALGRLTLSIATPPNVSNCTASGAGITSNTITLVSSAGSCAPVTFLRARNGVQVGTYTVSCSSPLNAGCIETDETLTVPAIDAGGYVVHARGKLGGVDCWILDEVIQVPAAAALTRTLNLVHQAIPGC